MAANADEQPGVVDGRALRIVEPDPLGQSQRDQAFAQNVFHRLAEAKIDAERQRRYELREANLGHGSTMDHRAPRGLL
ncbi:MAG TPA: hypothetical protein VH541_00145 [Gaiellaceae bacterium]